jgi:nucleoid-associated protein YgaU
MPSRYKIISTMKSDTGITSTSGKTMYKPTYYPNIEAQPDDNYILTGVTDRLDNIAFDFYGDATLWWAIAMANNLEGDSIYPPTGMYLRIPKDLSNILSKYNQSNNI